MADRPRRDGSQDEPEFTWLYGGQDGAQDGAQEGAPRDAPATDPDATRAMPRRPREPRPEETQVLPVQPREPVGTPARPAPPRRAPSGPPPGRPRPPQEPGPRGPGRRPRFRARWILALVLLWLVYLVAVPIVAWNKVDKVDFEPDGDRPGSQPGTTYLLVGSDSRAGLSAEERTALGTGNADGQRTDTIMLLHTGSGPNLLMSIPRDSIVDVPGHGTTRINAAYAFGGAPLLVRTIEGETGIRIDDYVEIGLGGLAGLVDAVGGITICPERAMKDKLANLDIPRGCQEADGATALGYARSRHVEQLGDIARARHQREVVSAVGAKVLSPWSFVNPVRYWRLNNAVPDFFAFGEGTGPVRAALWAMAMTRVDGSTGLTCGVPIADLAVTWDEDRSEQMFRAIRDDDTASIGDLCTPTGLPQGAGG